MTDRTLIELVETLSGLRFAAGCFGVNSDGYANATAETDRLLTEIRQRLAAVEREAARYQAIRGGIAIIHPVGEGAIYIGTGSGIYCDTPAEFDAEIDAAMEAANGNA